MVPQRTSRYDERESRGTRGRGPETVRVKLFGGFRVSVGLRAIEEGRWHSSKAAALVKLLALAPGHLVHREEVMDVLWPELDAKAAANNLRQALHLARRTLGSAPDTSSSSGYLVRRGELVELCPVGPLWVDVEAFEEAAATARGSREPGAYRAALDLYAGELLPEDRYEGWVVERREGLRGTYLALLLNLAKLHEERGEAEEAIEVLGQVLAAEPAREEAYAGLMRLYALSGRRGEALEQYERLREVLSRELGAEPAAASRRLREEIVAGRFSSGARPPQASRPLEESLRDGGHNLPAPRSSFVGRERERLEVKRTLAMTRLLTLAGSGGSGKTRLVLEVARDLVGMYPDGVWLVELAGLSEPELVPQTVATALGIREQPNRPLTATLLDALKARQKMLLVLDNCEHLIDACARLVDSLLNVCPRLRILATSREALEVVGEVTWPVPSLSAPETDRPPVGNLLRYEAVRLFVERAHCRLPAFELTQQNAWAVAEVCRKLDGMPLAIELATGRMPALTVEKIAARLEDSLGLLTSGTRTAHPRHRTLRAALGWSHDLLSEPERKLFRRLSVFAGGWTLEAAEVVGAGVGIQRDDILDLLCRLVEQSLIVAESGTEGAPRYKMLEPVHQYGWEKLLESEEADAERRRHADFFLGLAEEVGPKINASERAAWLAGLEAEHDNLRAALRWSVETEEAQTGLRLAGAIHWFWLHSGYSREGRAWLEGVLGLPRASAHTTARAEALGGVGMLAWLQGDHDSARFYLEESVALWRDLGGRQGLVQPLYVLSLEMLSRGYPAEARRLAEESVEIAREGEDGFALAMALSCLGLAARTQRDYAAARPILEESAQVCREIGDAWLLSSPLRNLGYIELREGDRDRAVALFEEGLSTLRGLGENWYTSLSVEGVAIAAAMRGEHERAGRLFGAAEAARETVGASFMEHYRDDYERGVAAARAALGERSFTALWAEGRVMSIEQATEYALDQATPTPPTAPTPPRPPAEVTMEDLLTAREREIAVLVARGYSNRRIAEELVISERTVETHISRTLKKLNLRSRAQIVAWRATQQLLR